MTGSEPAATAIETALEQLRIAVRHAVRAEQLVDRLTRLGNDEALSEWIQALIDRGEEFWLAFVEVDQFKNVNDEFGYDLADELLRRVALQLENGAANFFAGPVAPFRAHGDEFYVGGPGSGDGVHEALDQIRGSIAHLRVPTQTSPKPMKCTVSVGWATSADAQRGDEVLTARGLRGMLEAAVADAKRTRNCVVRFSDEMMKPATREGRADCGQCSTKLHLRVPMQDERSDPLQCPNCGGSIDRPTSLMPPQLPNN